MAKKRRSDAGSAGVSANATRWHDDVRAALKDLGDASAGFPKLFPGGITKIDIQLQAPGNTSFHLVVEGPDGRDDVAIRLADTPFELTLAPESLRTRTSPTEGTPEDQAKLTAGKTIQGAAKLFNRDCLSKPSSYANNCAHYLSDAFIQAEFEELRQAHDCISPGGRCELPNCKSGGKRPIRAKDLRCWFATKDKTPVTSVTKGTGFYAVYQERQSDGQGHVVILDSNTWKFYGTDWFEAGVPSDPWKHAYYQW